jgi:hypothetical protein
VYKLIFANKSIFQGGPTVQRFSSIFSQLLQLFPRLEFEQAVKKHRSDYSAKGFSSWGQFVAMLFCQFGRAHSHREICGGLASCEGKLRHLGVPDSPKRSTLAYANAHRSWSLYQTVFEQLLGKCQLAVAGREIRKKFRFKNKCVLAARMRKPVFLPGMMGERRQSVDCRPDSPPSQSQSSSERSTNSCPPRSITMSSNSCRSLMEYLGTYPRGSEFRLFRPESRRVARLVMPYSR